jgi:hypothetical protein
MTRAKTRGFTIVEMLIYLAISGAMFTVAFFGLRGQQDNVGFRQALDGIEQKIREVFNNVDNGYFGNAGQYTCSLSAGGYPQLQYGSGGGDSVACIYIGKTISFSSEQMTITTRIGARLGTNESEPSQLNEAYAISNSVIWQKSRICDQNSSCSDDVANLRVSAMRDRNDSINIQADLRAQRKYFDADSALWIGVTDNARPTYCFVLGDKTGSITITQKDIKVDYNGAGCR